MKNLFTQVEVVKLLNAERRKLKLNLTQFAERKGVSKQYMRSILLGLNPPSPMIGFEKVFFFKRTNGR